MLFRPKILAVLPGLMLKLISTFLTHPKAWSISSDTPSPNTTLWIVILRLSLGPTMPKRFSFWRTSSARTILMWRLPRKGFNKRWRPGRKWKMLILTWLLSVPWDARWWPAIWSLKTTSPMLLWLSTPLSGKCFRRRMTSGPNWSKAKPASRSSTSRSSPTQTSGTYRQFTMNKSANILWKRSNKCSTKTRSKRASRSQSNSSKSISSCDKLTQPTHYWWRKCSQA